MTWQDRFYQLMTESKYGTLSELCKAAGIASSTFGNALKGSHTPKPATMEKIAHVLGTTWQYLMNGDDKQAVPDTQVPVLKADQVQAWLDGKLSLESCEDVIHSPVPIRNRYFAWKIDTDDMEPEFNIDSYVIFDNEVDYKVSHWHHRMFILVGWLADVESVQFGMRNFQKMIENSSKKSTPTEMTMTTVFSDVTVCELWKTMHGYQLMSADRRFSTAMDSKKHQILAQARYGITAY